MALPPVILNRQSKSTQSRSTVGNLTPFVAMTQMYFRRWETLGVELVLQPPPGHLFVLLINPWLFFRATSRVSETGKSRASLFRADRLQAHTLLWRWDTTVAPQLLSLEQWDLLCGTDLSLNLPQNQTIDSLVKTQPEGNHSDQALGWKEKTCAKTLRV